MSAVLQENHVESIFDYDLNQNEEALLTCGLPREKYLSLSQDSLNKDLMSLFAMRGNSKKADSYMSKLDKDFVKLNIKWDSVHSEAN